jgi:hypothetical protein
MTARSRFSLALSAATLCFGLAFAPAFAMDNMSKSGGMSKSGSMTKSASSKSKSTKKVKTTAKKKKTDAAPNNKMVDEPPVKGETGY